MHGHGRKSLIESLNGWMLLLRNGAPSVLISLVSSLITLEQNALRGIYLEKVMSNAYTCSVVLQGAQKKIRDVMNTLGLSNTVMRLIERRTKQVTEKRERDLLFSEGRESGKNEGRWGIHCLLYTYTYIVGYSFPLLKWLQNA